MVFLEKLQNYGLMGLYIPAERPAGNIDSQLLGKGPKVDRHTL